MLGAICGLFHVDEILTYMYTNITFIYPQIYSVALKLALCLLAAVRTQTMFSCKG